MQIWNLKADQGNCLMSCRFCRSGSYPWMVVCDVPSLTPVPVFCLISWTKVIIPTLAINTFPRSHGIQLKLFFFFLGKRIFADIVNVNLSGRLTAVTLQGSMSCNMTGKWETSSIGWKDQRGKVKSLCGMPFFSLLGENIQHSLIQSMKFTFFLFLLFAFTGRECNVGKYFQSVWSLCFICIAQNYHWPNLLVLFPFVTVIKY